MLSGGELPAMALMDAVVRQLPGVLSDDASAVEDSFVNGLLDSPHYTRPEVYEGVAVPPVLMGGNHAEIVKVAAPAQAGGDREKAAGSDRTGARGRLADAGRRKVFTQFAESQTKEQWQPSMAARLL